MGVACPLSLGEQLLLQNYEKYFKHDIVNYLMTDKIFIFTLSVIVLKLFLSQDNFHPIKLLIIEHEKATMYQHGVILLGIKTSSKELSSAYDTFTDLFVSPTAFIQTSSSYIRSNRLREDIYRGYNDNIY